MIDTTKSKLKYSEKCDLTTCLIPAHKNKVPAFRVTGNIYLNKPQKPKKQHACFTLIKYNYERLVLKKESPHTYRTELGPNHDETGSTFFHSLSLMKFMKSFLVLGPR